MSPMFRKKPVVIEARQVGTGVSHKTLAAWCCGFPLTSGTSRKVVGIIIPTLEGDMRADLGDWIIKGVQGEFYPCKPTIFEATYEAVK